MNVELIIVLSFVEGPILTIPSNQFIIQLHEKIVFEFFLKNVNYTDNNINYRELTL